MPKLLSDQRLKWLRHELARQGNLRVRDAAAQLGVTVMTVWRDLQQLETLGEVRRVHGGALPALPADEQEPDYTAKAAAATEDRLKLARYAARRFPRAGQSISIEGGTTAISMLSHIESPHLTILTNSVEAMRQTRSTDTVLGCGGIYRHVSRTFVGPQAVDFFRTHRSDLCVISATGFRVETGLTDPNPMEIEVKQAMCDASAKVVLLLDRSKFGKRSLSKVLDLQKVHTLVTNEGIPAAELKPFRRAGVCIELV